MKKRFLVSLICCLVFQGLCIAAPDLSQSIIPQAGTINVHDLQNIKHQQIEKQVQEDYKKYEKRKKDGNVKPEQSKTRKGKVVKAKLEEYATKGVYVENIEVAPSLILTENEIKKVIIYKDKLI